MAHCLFLFLYVSPDQDEAAPDKCGNEIMAFDPDTGVRKKRRSEETSDNGEAAAAEGGETAPPLCVTVNFGSDVPRECNL